MATRCAAIGRPLNRALLDAMIWRQDAAIIKQSKTLHMIRAMPPHQTVNKRTQPTYSTTSHESPTTTLTFNAFHMDPIEMRYTNSILTHRSAYHTVNHTPPSSPTTDSSALPNANVNPKRFSKLLNSFKAQLPDIPVRFSSFYSQIREPQTSLRDLWEILITERTRLQAAAVALSLGASVQVAFPAVLGRLIDGFNLSEASFGVLTQNIHFCVITVGLWGLLSFIRLFLLRSSAERIAYRLRSRLFQSIMQQPVSFADKNLTGSLINRLSGDIAVASSSPLEISGAIRSFISAFAGSAMVLHLAPAGLFPSLIIPVILTFSGGYFYGKLVHKLSFAKQEAISNLIQHAEERIASFRTVRLFNGESLEQKQFDKNLDKVYDVAFKHVLTLSIGSLCIISTGGLFLTYMIYQGGLMVASGAITFGNVFSLLMYCVYAGGGIQGIFESYGEIQKALGATGKVLDIIKLPSDLPKMAAAASIFSTTDGSPSTPSMTTKAASTPTNSVQDAVNSTVAYAPTHSVVVPAIEFKDVWFAYPNRPNMYAVKGLSFCIPDGAKLAIVGESGSGKSSITSLLLRLYEPQHGEIYLNSTPTSTMDPRRLRSLFGTVNQEPTLFAGSIRENILYGYNSHQAMVDAWDGVYGDEHTVMTNTEIDAAVERATQQAYVDEFINSFPDKLETYVGERGQSLSGGQKQRVCIARALLRNPKYLIFDEATSALDMNSEKFVHDAIYKAMENRTTILIAHRLSTLKFSDYIGILSDGAFVQFGRKQDVLENPCVEFRRILLNMESQV